MSSILINLIGSPSVGKSTTAGKLFAKLKDMNLNTELVQEYIKHWVYEKRPVGPFDQFYVFGKEVHQQSRLFGAVDIIISDSSPILAAFYHFYYNGNNALSNVCHNFYELVDEAGVKVINFFLPRKKKYIAKGRYQSEQEADALALQLKEWLDKEGYSYITLDCPDEERVDVVLEKLKEMTGDFDGMVMA
jgi:nicotinamide riboside kinase